MIAKRILIVEDEEIMRISLTDALTKEGYQISVATDGEEGWETFQRSNFPLVLLDLKMPKMDGIAFLRKIKAVSPETIVIMITAYGTIETAVQAMRLGAYDYVTKPFLVNELLLVIKRALEYYDLKKEDYLLQGELKDREGLDRLIGQDEKMQEVYSLIRTVAPTDATVLIYGESGTGKELAAEAIHHLSPRKNGPLIKVSCAALPEGILESELFGHEKGAFTDALNGKPGRFELADGGTLFLDDIDNMNLNIQVKLLRVLQEKKFERVGGVKTLQVDVRLIAASKTNLLEAVLMGTFREDLYYRLNVVPIFMPPLRERKGDIPLLINHFTDKYTGGQRRKVSLPLIQMMVKYDWPGNVRELENVIERMVVLSRGRETLSTDLYPVLKIEGKKWRTKPIQEVVKEAEKEHIVKVLKETNGRKEEAAKTLGISRKTLWQKIKELKIEV